MVQGELVKQLTSLDIERAPLCVEDILHEVVALDVRFIAGLTARGLGVCDFTILQQHTHAQLKLVDTV